MPLVPGTQLGPYEITAPLGAGGMGEVYRARDTRLDRSVAIKVLPAQFSSDPVRKQRFEREAKTISSLNHPHICVLHDIGHQDGTDYLVMECVEGETFAKRLEKGPLPIDQVLKYGAQIADALDRAHRKGVVHRDLKPGNIMLTKSGVKLLDFGLAKPLSEAFVGDQTFSVSPTEKQALTAEGTIFGTVQYMSPEQLEGKETDARSDIFSFGAVLYEMVTGKHAFGGKSQASVIAAILEHEPQPISAFQPMAPPVLDRLVRACLAKDPDDRWQTAHDLTLQLGWLAEAGSETELALVSSRRPRKRKLLAWAGLGVLALVALVLALVRLQPSANPRPVRFFVTPPEKSTFNFIGRDAGPATVSPDGAHLAFVAVTPEGKKLLFVRPLSLLSAQALAGTDGASYPFWSADGLFLGFFADGKMKKVPATGGMVQTICDAPLGRGGAWNRDGVILFAPGPYLPLYRVQAAGGEVTPVTKFEPGSDYSHRWPQFLPDGRHFLYLSFSTVLSPQRGYPVRVGSLDSNENKVLLQSAAGVAYAPPGYLLFLRERTLMAAPFEPSRLRVTGDAFPIAEQIQTYPNTASAIFSASQNGILVYQAGADSAVSTLVWFDSSGRKVGPVTPPGDYEDPRLSRDGQYVAVDRFDPNGGVSNIWMYSVSRNIANRVTFDPSFDHSPVWAPDGRRVAFDTNRNGPADLYLTNLAALGSEEALIRSNEQKTPTDWSPDGKLILYQLLNANKKYDLWVIPVEGNRKPFPFLSRESNVMGGQFSPDGHWVAYYSDESGRWEIYVAAFPGPGGKRQISTAGGTQPRWQRDGRRIFFLAADRKLMAADIKPGPTLEVETPKPLFDVRARYTGNAYDVSPDGRRFLINTLSGAEASSPLTVVLDWTAELKR